MEVHEGCCCTGACRETGVCPNLAPAPRVATPIPDERQDDIERRMLGFGMTSAPALLSMRVIEDDFDDARARDWLAMWGAIGWHAKVDIVLRMFDGFAQRAYNTMAGHDKALTDHQAQLDNNLLDIRKLQRKVRS